MGSVQLGEEGEGSVMTRERVADGERGFELLNWSSFSSNSGTKKGEDLKKNCPPKRNLSAFIWFCKVERSNVKDRNPDFDINDIAKEQSRLWKSMNSDAKKQYEDMAEVDKARYEREMAEYKMMTMKAEPQANVVSEENDVGDKEGQSLGEVERPISDADLLRIMECPVCSEFPIPPIFSCGKGHFTCNSCMKLLEVCPLCESPFTGVRNFALESIIENSQFKCRNSHLGCAAIVAGGELSRHVMECLFRPLECGEPDCLKSSLTPAEYFEHMAEQHGLTGCFKQLIDGKTGIILKQNEESDYPPFFVKLYSGEKDGPTFIIMTKRYRTFMCWWITCLEPQMLSKYDTVLLLENKSGGTTTMSVNWNLPLQPTWKSFDEIRDTGLCAVIPDTHLIPFYTDEKGWDLKVEIKKKGKRTGHWLANFQHYYPLLVLILIGIFAVLFSMVVEYGISWCDSWRVLDAGGNDSVSPDYTAKNQRDFSEQYIGYRGFYYKV